MKSFELRKTKSTVLIVLFVITAVMTYISMNYKPADPVFTTMDSATLPIVMMKTANGTLFNALHGYTSDIDATLFNDSVTPLPSDKKLPIVIDYYGENVTALSYEIRKIDDSTLIENTTVKDFEHLEGSIEAVLNIKNLIENDTEYMLKIILITEKHEKISYFTKVFASSEIGLQEKLDFAKNFNSYTFDSTQLDKISQWIETKSSGDNSNYGKVNINSSKSQIGWGGLNPSVESTIIPVIKDISSEIASIYLEYNMVGQNAEDFYDSYEVKEYYRVRQANASMYLLNFEREANQVFDSRNDLTQSSRINLGISSSDKVNMKSSEDGKYTCFVRNGILWAFDDRSNTFTRIFSFEAEESDNVRELYMHHDIKIMDISIDKNKDYKVDFMVYGYMNRGAHEGKVGVSLCTYNDSTDLVDELLFIPVGVPFELLSENVGEVAYISESGIFYIMLDESLYSIDLTSKEMMVEITGLRDGTYSVSGDGKSIAYSTNGKENGTESIRIFNMGTGSDYIIKAGEGEKIRVLGYIQNDFIYGTAYDSDILNENNGTVTFPMYRLDIIDSSYNKIKEYQVEGAYVSSTSISGMRLNINRVVKNAEGGYESTSMDQLINRDEHENVDVLSVDVVNTDSRKAEAYIKLVNKITNASKAVMRTSKEVVFTSGKTIDIESAFQGQRKYYVYGFGAFRGSYNSLDKAVLKANETYGTILSRDSKYVWKRYKQNTASISNVSVNDSGGSLAGCVRGALLSGGYDVPVADKMAAGMNALEIINEATGGKALNLKGVAVENILYYINIGIPVIGRTGDSSYVLITGYDAKNIIYYDAATGKETALIVADADKLFTQWGNVFVAYYR